MQQLMPQGNVEPPAARRTLLMGAKAPLKKVTDAGTLASKMTRSFLMPERDRLIIR